jgi:hypothetical protein
VLTQVAGITVDDDTIASVVAVLGSTRRPVEMDRARIDRRIRELALEHAAGALGDDTYLARLTSAAYAHGLALALPEGLQWRARQESSVRVHTRESG